MADMSPGVVLDGKPWPSLFGMVWAPSFNPQNGSLVAPVRHEGAWRMFEDQCLDKAEAPLMQALTKDASRFAEGEVATATEDGKMLLSGVDMELPGNPDVFVHHTSGTTMLPEGYFAFCSLHFSTYGTDVVVDLEELAELQARTWLGADMTAVGGKVRSLPVGEENVLDGEDYRSFFAAPGFPPAKAIWVQQGEHGTGIGINRFATWEDKG